MERHLAGERKTAGLTPRDGLYVEDALFGDHHNVICLVSPHDHLEQFFIRVFAFDVKAYAALNRGIDHVVHLEVVPENLAGDFPQVGLVEIENDLLLFFVQARRNLGSLLGRSDQPGFH